MAEKKIDKDVPLDCQAQGTSLIGARNTPSSKCNMRLIETKRRICPKQFDLTKIIESLRNQLVALVREQGFSSHAVIELSQHLDKYILVAQNRKKENC